MVEALNNCSSSLDQTLTVGGQKALKFGLLLTCCLSSHQLARKYSKTPRSIPILNRVHLHGSTKVL